MKRLLVLSAFFAGGACADEPRTRIAEKLVRTGDEIVVCGQLFHTTTKVVLWTDPGGYDAYRAEPRFGPDGGPVDRKTKPDLSKSGPGWRSHYDIRRRGLSAAEFEQARAGVNITLLQRVVDQFVIHFDAVGISQWCFQVLHDERGLSVHFMLDLDGTVYQTLDLKESARHATIANGRSIGIEVANIGAFALNDRSRIDRWYKPAPDGKIRLVDPTTSQPLKLATSAVELKPSREDLIVGTIQRQELQQYDFTTQQYDSLAKLTATLCTIFPKIRCDYPRDASGALRREKLPNPDYEMYQGILGHFHVQANKVDPGPAFQWDRLIDSSRKLLAR